MPPVRLGFTATKKIGNAVARNRARRRLRAAAAETLLGSAPDAVDLVLIARRETINRPYADLKNDLSAALHRLGVLR
jgi:ribonuclease P protein component